MAKVYDRTDFVWSSRGDFVFNSGDLLDTDYDPLRSLVQEVRTRVKSDIRGWKPFPDIGANLSDYVGEPNNKSTAEAIKTRVIASLTQNSFVAIQDLKVMYAPVTEERLMIRITIAVAPTGRNGSSQSLTLNMIYSYSDNNVYYIS